MEARDLRTINPLPLRNFVSCVIAMLILTCLGVVYSVLGNGTRDQQKLVKKEEATIRQLEDEIRLLQVDLERAQDNGRLSSVIADLEATSPRGLVSFDEDEVIKLQAPPRGIR